MAQEAGSCSISVCHHTPAFIDPIRDILFLPFRIGILLLSFHVPILSSSSSRRTVERSRKLTPAKPEHGELKGCKLDEEAYARSVLHREKGLHENADCGRRQD